MGLLKFGQRHLLAVKGRAKKLDPIYRDLEPDFWQHRDQIIDYTMTSVARQYALYKAVHYVSENRIEGSFVECGVWRGGSSLLAALVFTSLNDLRDLWLYDTFSGMTPPTPHDAKRGASADRTAEIFKELQRDDHNDWCYASLDDVKSCLAKSAYPPDKINYVVGDVLRTIPSSVPKKISILRLDTDFYDSTKHELEHLYDLLVPGGILLIDDYGAWEGARKAVDEYFGNLLNPPFLARTDDTGRIMQKFR